MDKIKSIRNVTTSIFSRVILLIVALIVRRILIQYIGNDVNGLNSLYTSIIGMLGVAELGIGNAIVFSMYKPIVAGEKRQIAALYNLYKRLYKIIGIVIFAAGLFVIPFLPRLISDYDSIHENVYITFLLTLVSVVLSYSYSAKTSLIEAHKDNYITTGILTIAGLVRYGLQIIAILIWRSFPAFLICQIIGTIIIWILTDLIVRRRYRDIIETKAVVDNETRVEISQNVRAMVMHRVGTVLVHSVDSIIISSFIGVAILGKYSNYTYICSVMVGVISLFFSPLTSVVGHLCAAGDNEETKKWFDHFYTGNYILAVVFFLGYYAVIDGVVKMLFGENLEVSRPISFVITLNSFTQYMRSAGLLFRNASGTFYNDRWKPVGEGVANLILSLLFVQIFPEEYKVVGVIVATIITTLFICFTVEPFVIFKHVFGKSPKGFYIRNYCYVAFFTTTLFGLTYLLREKNSIDGILSNGFISIGMSVVMLGCVSLADKSFRKEIMIMESKLISAVRRK